MPDIDNQRATLSKRELSFGYWLATHRVLLHNLTIGFFGLVAAMSVIIFILNTVNWASHIQQTNQILTDLGGNDIDYSAIRKPEAVAVRSAKTVIRDAGTIDLIVDISNPNDIWAATNISYQVEVAGKILGPFTVNLAPNEEKFIAKQSIPFTGTTAPSAKGTVLDTTWEKYADTSRLPTDNWMFTNAHYGYVQTSAVDAPYRTELTFILENRSVYGFRGVEVVVELKNNNDDLAGVASVTLDSVLTASTRPLTFRWPLRLPIDVTPVIHVNVNRLDENSIIRTRE